MSGKIIKYIIRIEYQINSNYLQLFNKKSNAN